MEDKARRKDKTAVDGRSNTRMLSKYCRAFMMTSRGNSHVLWPNDARNTRCSFRLGEAIIADVSGQMEQRRLSEGVAALTRQTLWPRWTIMGPPTSCFMTLGLSIDVKERQEVVIALLVRKMSTWKGSL